MSVLDYIKFGEINLINYIQITKEMAKEEKL